MSPTPLYPRVGRYARDDVFPGFEIENDPSPGRADILAGIAFDGDAFVTGIRIAMAVGLPPEVADQPTFFFPPVVTNTAPADAEGVPFDAAQTPVVAQAEGVLVPCAIDYKDARGVMTEAGVITRSRIEITLLGRDYVNIEGFSYVLLGGERFDYTSTEAPVGMLSESIYTIHAEARDDT